MSKIKVLFVCVHNSGRSQIAEAYLKHFGKDKFEVESAGIEPSVRINPLVVKVMSEEGFDLSSHSIDKVFDYYKAGKTYHYVITVCDESNSERCPIFPGTIQRMNWSFTDPSGVDGSEEEKLEKVRKIREEIKTKIKEFIDVVS